MKEERERVHTDTVVLEHMLNDIANTLRDNDEKIARLRSVNEHLRDFKNTAERLMNAKKPAPPEAAPPSGGGGCPNYIDVGPAFVYCWKNAGHIDSCDFKVPPNI
jgi:hypothetical protein